jgi:hypothetical protein
MAGTDLDRALLGEDLTSKVTLQNVASLSPVQLAVVAARDDLERQVQNRACTAFLRKKAVFDAAGGTEDPSQGQSPSLLLLRGGSDGKKATGQQDCSQCLSTDSFQTGSRIFHPQISL